MMLDWLNGRCICRPAGLNFGGPKMWGVCCQFDRGGHLALVAQIMGHFGQGEPQNGAVKVGWGEANFDFGAGS